jgi:hypothetical protein
MTFQSTVIENEKCCRIYGAVLFKLQQDRQNQSTTETCENRNDPDLVQAFLKK